MSSDSPVTMRCDISQVGAPIGNRFSNMSFWHSGGTTADERTWYEWAEQRPENWLIENYPWLQEMQIYVATGGSYIGYPGATGDTCKCELNRDLFVDPSDRNNLTDYDFRPLVRACRNMLRQGVKPCLKLHAVPIKYSSKPKIGWFRVNVRPPDDYDVYYDYLKSCVEAMVDAFGMEEVGSWRWFVMTEMENKDWWEACDESPETTQAEFFKMYDYSVAALEDALGSENVKVGAHAMMLSEGGFWDARTFLDHCVSGTNHKRGSVGSRLDFLAISYYDRSPGEIEKDDLNSPLESGANLCRLDPIIHTLEHKAKELGMSDLPIEVSEGGILFGMDGKWLWHGLCTGGAFDVSWTALSFKKMIDLDIALWSRWPNTRTAGIFKGIDVGTTNLLRLLHRMSGDRLVPVTLADAPDGCDSAIVQAVSSYESLSNTVRILVFHHAKDITVAVDDTPITVQLPDIEALSGGAVTVRKWVIDEDHNDFWKQWEKDRTAHGIKDDDYRYSRDQVYAQHALKTQAHIDFWHSQKDVYESLSALSMESEADITLSHSTLTLDHVMKCFSIVFYEISNVVAKG